jgi:hypothetical protein
VGVTRFDCHETVETIAEKVALLVDGCCAILMNSLKMHFQHIVLRMMMEEQCRGYMMNSDKLMNRAVSLENYHRQ